MTYSLPPQALDRDLVFEFFWKFSVFEYALKREGFVRPGSDNAAQPDWDRFGREVSGRFAQVSVSDFKKSVDALRRLSPQRQVVRDGRLRWDPLVQRKDESDEAFAASFNAGAGFDTEKAWRICFNHGLILNILENRS